jgi:hypothetical protein
MKKIDLIAVIFFSIIICLKFWLLLSGPIEIPKILYFINIFGIISIFAVLGEMRYRNEYSKYLIPIAFLLGIIENVWRYQITDIGFLSLCFRIFGYVFFCFLLWSWSNVYRKPVNLKH